MPAGEGTAGVDRRPGWLEARFRPALLGRDLMASSRTQGDSDGELRESGVADLPLQPGDIAILTIGRPDPG